MVLLNLWSLGHFIQWFGIGFFTRIGWPLFLFLSIGWEVLEIFLPYEFTEEVWQNKISDLVVNTVGFQIGRWCQLRRLQVGSEDEA
ncbi:MAG: hypothetical protein VX433_03000 [Candidatus Thermoplasmatota archaeon]|nr:hypothetical protein [Candidatus Thermoplasmatota archaeon]